MGLTWCAAKDGAGGVVGGWEEVVVVDSDWLIWFGQVTEEGRGRLWTVELSQIT